MLNREHTQKMPQTMAQQMLETMAGVLEASDEECERIDGSAPPRFGEWQLKGLKTAWSCEMAPTDRHPSEVWLALWKADLSVITLEFMHKVVWKKLVVRE